MSAYMNSNPRQICGFVFVISDVYASVEESFYQRFRLYNHWQLMGECEKANTFTPSFLRPLDLNKVELLVKSQTDKPASYAKEDWKALAKMNKEDGINNYSRGS